MSPKDVITTTEVNATATNDLVSENSISYFEQFVLFLDDFEKGDYVTWGLVFMGWVIALGIACWQLKTNKSYANQQKIEKLKNNLLSRLDTLEDESINFWVNEKDKLYLVALDRFARDIKAITSLAQQISKISEIGYKKNKFRKLRKSITYVDRTRNIPKAINYADFQINEIKTTCLALRSHYKV